MPLPDLPLPDVPDVETPDVMQPGEQAPLAERINRRPLTSRIPAPQQISTEPRVVGTNAFLAILMALIFGATSAVLGNMLRDEEHRLHEWLSALGLDRLVTWLGKAFGWSLSKAAVRRGCLTLPLVAVIFATYGIIFAFLEEGTSILSREGAFLAVMMAFSVGLVSFAGDIARRIAGMLWRSKSRFNVYPINLGLAVITVALSRLLHLSPGIAFGTPGGADLDLPPAVAERREVTLSLMELGFLVLFGALGWAASGTVLSMLDASVTERAAATLGNLLSAVQNTGLVLFFVALETVFFEMLPLTYSMGQTIFRWSKPVWALLFAPLAFLFNHTLLNPQSGFLDSFSTSNVRFLWFVLFVLVGVTAALWFYFNLLDDALKDVLGVRRTPSR